MANSGSGTSNRDVPEPAGFTFSVDTAIRNSAPNSGASSVHSFASIVDNALSSTSGGLGAFPVHDFAFAVDNAIRSTGGDLGAFPVQDFAFAVDNAIRSTGGDLGAFPVHDFAFAVDNAIRSTGGDLGAFPVHDFASALNNAMASSGGALGAFPVHSFASVVNNAMNSIGGDLGTSHFPVHVSSDVEDLQSFTLAELEAATNKFSVKNVIGEGTIGVGYRGKLVNGREVVIKRIETSFRMKEFQDIVLGYFLTLLPRLHYKNLVGLVGFCKEKDKRLLVYEYMKNGTLYDHLHDKGSNVLNSWKMRIKIALDASQGIQYLHNYAVQSIIHGGIQSCNILLDATWTARVSDVGLTFMKNTTGPVGYIDPEYLCTSVLTTESDVYGLGVVLLELLTGKKAVFRYVKDGCNRASSVVDFAVPVILGEELVKILDPRVGAPDVNEAEAVELMTRTAIRCVTWERKDRPTTDDIVLNLERALAICHSSYDSISSGTIPVLLPKKKRKNSVVSE